MKFSKSIYSLVLLLLLISFGCNEDKLNVKPVNEYLVENFYRTDAQVYSALVAAYDPVGWSMAFGNWISPVMFGEIRSDNAHAGGDASDNDQPGWQELDDFRETNTNLILQPAYRRNYIGIMRSNLVILMPKFTSPAVTRYQAEAKFLRAYYHFELFKLFGPIPVVKTLLTPDDTDLDRDNMTTVFTAITEDLLEAIENLPATLSSEESGRASRGSAQALLGKVYLYWADMDGDDAAKFTLAAQQLSAVVQSGQYELEDDFNDLYSFGSKNTRESVFEAQHTNLWPSDWGWFEGIEGNGIVQLCGIRGLCSGHPTYAAGWGFMLPTAGLNNHFLSDDEYRRDATIISVAEIQADAAGQPGCATPVSISESNPTDYTGFWQQKYANYKGYNGNNINGGDPNLTKDANTYIIRYADVLLMLAEALHRGAGDNATARLYIDQVRERSAGPGDNTGNFRTAQDLIDDEGMSLLDVIWYERRAELAGEGDRWFDLVRSGRASATLFAGDPLRGSNFSDTRLWIPIALEETSVAKNLTTYPDQSLFQ